MEAWCDIWRDHGQPTFSGLPIQASATALMYLEMPRRAPRYAPMYRAYRLRATPMSVVPLIMARPSGKIVNK